MQRQNPQPSDAPTSSVDENFAQSLHAHLVAQTTESWMFWYGLLQAFVEDHGHCRVPQKHVTADGYRLGAWASTQRTQQARMAAGRKACLNALGFDWNPQANKRRISPLASE
jgi:hypothetical protein